MGEEIGLAIANFCSEMILPPGASIYSLIAAYENAAADPLEVFRRVCLAGFPTRVGKK